jgi:DNA polymerase-1
VRDNLEQHAEQVRLGKRIVTIRRDVPVELDLNAARWLRYDVDRARQAFDALEFRQLFTRMPLPDAMPVQPVLEFEPSDVPGVRIAEPSDVAEVRELLRGAEDVAVVGLWDGSARSGRLCGLAIAAADATWYLPAPIAREVGEELGGRRLSAHDVKEMQLVLRSAEITGRALDWRFSTFLAAYLLGAGSRDPRLEDLARDLLGMGLRSVEELLGTGRKAILPSACPPGEAAEYTGGRARAILELGARLEAEMKNLGVDYLYHEVELPLASVLAEMEEDGVAIDGPYLEAMHRDLAEQLRAIEAEVHELAGQEFNLNAPQQLAKLLFEDLGLPVGRRTKTGYSTDADTLEALRDKHPVVPLILDHRQLSKLTSTYVDALPQLVDARTGRLHTSWNQAASATGRLSSSNPNLMNIPIRSELGQQIRRAFKAGAPDRVMFAADYSQIELRIAAHLSEDPELLGAFEAGHDIHAATAARIFKVPIEEVLPNQRRLAKVANFGSIYGQGEFGLAQQMGIPRDEARAFLKEYWSTYAHLREWLDGIRERAREDGVVVSVTGRRRAIPDLRSPNYMLRQGAERMAINFPIQSLAADIIKIAMVRLHREMAEHGMRGRMLLQVHDELVFELPAPELEAFGEMVPRVMVGAYELAAGLEVESKAGPNWADMERLSTTVA